MRRIGRLLAPVGSVLPATVATAPSTRDVANVDYLMWWSRGASLPPLVTTGSQGGALNDPNLKILFGNDRVDNTIRSGGRLNIGTWFNPQQTFGIGATFLQLQNMASNFTDVSNGSPIVARPFFNTATQAPDSLVYGPDGSLCRRGPACARR